MRQTFTAQIYTFYFELSNKVTHRLANFLDCATIEKKVGSMNSIKLWLSIPVFAMLAACGDDGHESPVQGPEDDSSSEEIQSSSSGKVSSSSRGNNVSSSESDKKSSSSTNYVCSIYTLSDALSCKCNSSVEGKLSYNYDSNVELVCYHDEELDKWGWITNPSASDEDESSSSTAESSSSEIKIVMAEPCRDDTEDNCEYDTLEDERDGESYKTVKIGPQEWMTENLRYEGEERMQLCLPVLMAGICPLMLTS